MDKHNPVPWWVTDLPAFEPDTFKPDITYWQLLEDVGMLRDCIRFKVRPVRIQVTDNIPIAERLRRRGRRRRAAVAQSTTGAKARWISWRSEMERFARPIN